MGRRPNKCYRALNKKANVNNKHNRVGPLSKLVLFDLGNKKGGLLTFPARIDLVSNENENLSSEALEAARICANKCLVKIAGKESFHMRICCRAICLLRVNKMLTCAGADRLQTGMRNSYGKPYGRCARIYKNRHIINIRTKYEHVKTAIKALTKAKAKLPGCQTIQVSDKFGFTGFYKEEFMKLKEEGMLLQRGYTVSVIKKKGPVSEYLSKRERAI